MPRSYRVGWILVGCAILAFATSASAAELQVGLADADITPKVDDPQHPVWMAGYGPGRQANEVHDPLMVRATVLSDGEQKIAIACADLVGLQYPTVQKIRDELADFKYVLVSSTHNHEAPDVVGLWGASLASRGVDDAYLELVVKQTVAAIRAAEKQLAPAQASYGTATDEALLGDSRLPDVRDGVLRVLKFINPQDELLGIVVQWNCHPEAMGSRNKALTADFVAATVSKLKARHKCPVTYVTGAVGGLMAPPDDGIENAQGEQLHEGDFEYTRVYGEKVADLADQALAAAAPITLTPFVVSAKPIALPVSNPYYRAAHVTGVVQRPACTWTGDAEQIGKPFTLENASEQMAVLTEVGYLKLGELALAAIPGEIYPELVYGKFPKQAEPGVDFPTAPLEPHVTQILATEKWLLIGLANDEIGYIIPKRQWDNAAPYAYGKARGQYGEINSCGSDVAPVLMKALQQRVAEAR